VANPAGASPTLNFDRQTMQYQKSESWDYRRGLFTHVNVAVIGIINGIVAALTHYINPSCFILFLVSNNASVTSNPESREALRRRSK